MYSTFCSYFVASDNDCVGIHGKWRLEKPPYKNESTVS